MGYLQNTGGNISYSNNTVTYSNVQQKVVHYQDWTDTEMLDGRVIRTFRNGDSQVIYDPYRAYGQTVYAYEMPSKIAPEVKALPAPQAGPMKWLDQQVDSVCAVARQHIK